MNLTDVLERLYKSEINCGIQSFWDVGWNAWIGDGDNGFDSESSLLPVTLDDVAAWLDREARRLYPLSDYAKQAALRRG